MRYSSAAPASVHQLPAEGQLQFAFSPQRFCPLPFDAAKTPRHIGGDPGIKAIISGSDEIEKPAHGKRSVC
jgi:hypothetical protein